MKIKYLIPLLLLASFSPAARALQSYSAWCEVGNTKANISGSTSANTLQASYPKCTVTVYVVGTTTKATLFSDNIPTPLANPFTAAANGSFTFYAVDGNYDVTTSGGLNGGFPIPVTTPNVHLVTGSGGGGGGACSGTFQQIAYFPTQNTCAGDPLFLDKGTGLAGGLSYTGNGAFFNAANSGSYTFISDDPTGINQSAVTQFTMISGATDAANFNVTLDTSSGTGSQSNSGDINLFTSGNSTNGNNIFLTAIANPLHSGSGNITLEGEKVLLKADSQDITLQSVGGINLSSGSAPTTFDGGIAPSTAAVSTTPYTIPTNRETTTLYNASGNAIVATLPTTTADGTIFIQKKIDSSSNTVTITSSTAIDNASTFVLKFQYQWVAMQYDGPTGGWHVFATGPAYTGSLTPNDCVQVNATGNGFVDSGAGCGGGGGGGSAFNALTSGSNTTAAMVVGTGASLLPAGSGTIGATSVGGITITGTPSVGQIPTATSGSTATWQAAPASPSFSVLTSGTNTGAAMLVGSGASLAPTGSGSIAATTAVALATTPTVCGANQYAAGVDTGGNAVCIALPTQPSSQYIAPQAISGCGVEYVSGLSYTIGACTYSINGTIYHSATTNTTLGAADPTNPRIDVIYVDTTQTVQVIPGVPAATPQQPAVDPSTQLELTFVLVPAAATTPGNTTLVDIYMEGVEWTGAKGGTNGSRVNLTSTSNPYSGTHDTEFGVGGTVATTTFAGYTVPSAGTVNLANYNTLTFYLRNKAAWLATNSITVQWYNGTTLKGTGVVLSNGAFGFNATTNTSTYQQVSIPVSTFGIAGIPVTSVRFTVSGSGAALTGFYLDQITLQGGSGGVILPTTLMNFKGAWSSTATYNPNDTVTNGGVGYVALLQNTNVVTTTTTTWAALGSGGGGGGTLSTIAAGTWPSWLTPTIATPSGPTATLSVAAGPIPYSAFTGVAANSVLGALTATTPSALPMPSCFTSGTSALIWTPGVGFGCNAISGGGGGGNTTSTSLTNNFLPKSNGVNSIIDSKLSDDGTNLVYHGTGTVGSLSLVEGTAATGVAASDIFYADSTAHRWKMNNNAGGAFFLPGVAVAGTSGHSVAFAANGIDLVDGGSSGASNPSTCTVNSATDLCVTLSPYNASTAGATTTTTSGTFGVGTSGTITSCSTFSANQGIYIAGAGAAGANYIGTVVSCTAGALVVTPATSTSVAGGTVVQHDESAAIQAAITALATTGGTIYFPDGLYLVNGAKQDTGGANAILKLPNATYGSTAPVAIALKGFNLPAIDAAANGAIIQTSLASGNLIGGYNNVGTFAPITSYWLDIENLTFRGYSNPGFTAINATTIAAAHLNHVWCDIGSSSTDPSNAAGACVRMPELTNNVSNTLDDVTAIGYYTGFVLTEHTQVGSMYAATCHDAFLFDTGTNAGAPGTYVGNSISVDYLWSISCHHGVSGGSNLTSVNIQNADIELPIDFAIYDPSNKLMGTINYTNPYTNQYTITTSGAANVHLNNIPYPTLAFSGNGTNGALNFYRNSHTADSSISNPSAGELQANVESTSGQSFQIQGTSTSAIFNVRTSCSTCYAEFSAGTFPNWVENMYFPSGWTQGGFYDIPNAAVMVAGTGATAGILLDTRATAPLKFATHDTLALTLDGSTQAATFVAGVTAPNVTDSALVSGKAVKASTAGLLADSGLTMPAAAGSATVSQTIASGTSALGTSAISSATCATVVTTTATGAASTDSIIWNPNASIKAVTGYTPATTGGLTIAGYPTTNAVNWDVCNWTSSSITPGAVTLNWRVVR